MSFQEITKEELQIKLAELQDQYDSLKQKNEDKTDFYKSVLATSPTGFIEISLQGDILSSNAAFAELIGYTQEELSSMKISDIEAQETQDEIQQHIDLLLATKHARFETKHRRKDGTIIDVEVKTQYLPDYKKFISFISNITNEINAKEEIIKAKQEAEIKELKYRKLTENIPGMVYKGRRDWTYDIISNSEVICGYTAQEFLDGKISWIDLILPDDIEYVLSHAQRFFKAPLSEVHEYRIRTKDNSIRYIADHLSSVFNEEGKLESIEGIVFDITERKRDEQLLQERNEELRAAKEKAEESDRLKSAFLANMSHDIRTPLNSIVGFSQLIAEENSSAQLKNYADIIQSQNSLLLKLVDDIMDLAKIEAGVIKIQQSKFNIHLSLNKLESIFKEQCKKQNIQLCLSKPQDDLFLYSDEQRIEQVFFNLITNALKFTKEGEICFGYELNGDDKLRCFVKDTGIGIPKDKQQKIFDRFTKLDEFMQGTGLGLSIVKNIVELLGGKIWFISTPEKGTTFFFELPLHQSEEKDSVEEFFQI
ncbi:PAS domain-containing sensor histidine kinase [Puteibacter caeruleilacunae]|nr:PAS domain-containing sensor histidine kinase [Puteibacter caeruleilacunae]